ncbi:MAG TPA: SH3 domain-containing protein [Tepidisphaeraceae bacterium]|nr:SH3 domain-containing protein [Tepidisphaeraceae bacterium]
MSARRFLLISTLSFAALGILAAPAIWAEDAGASPDASSPDTEVSARHEFIGQINANDVFVRSGPREDAYATMKLDKGAKVTVVGMKFNYLKILPPEGSFAYVPQVYVDRRGDGTVGRANREIIARVGSELNDMKIETMAKVDEGDDVQIIGSEDEYFKIKPPEGSYLYIDKSFVDPLQVVTPPGQPPIVRAAPAGSGATPAPAPAPGFVNAGPGPTTLPAGQLAATPTTMPAGNAAEATAKFNKLEADFTAANDKSITDQPLADLTAGYTAFEKDPGATSTEKKIADVRLSTLKLRTEARNEFLAVKDAQAKMLERQKSLQAEESEIKDRIAQNDITYYTVVGTLRTSSLQNGRETLYRLTDPATGRTVAYIRSNDSKYPTLLGQFIGIRGTLTTDSSLNMKMVTDPSVAEAVDSNKVNNSVAAQLIPPSMMPKPAQASADIPGGQ